MAEEASAPAQAPPRPSLLDLLQVFLTIGVIGFGGPAAHVALMRREIVERRNWLTESRFLQMFAACSLIPGPSSTELAMFLGYDQAGWRGLLLAGSAFITPAAVLMVIIAWIYTRFSTAPALHHVLYGVRPVVIAIVAWALWDLGRKILARRLFIPLAAAVFALFLIGANPILLLAVAGVVTAVMKIGRDRLDMARLALMAPLGVTGLGQVHAYRLPAIFLTFLKIGAVAYGSGYVLLAFLHTDFVGTLHWINDRQLVDAIAIGQTTPGPVFTTATFLGYLFAGVPGAVLATVAIFLPGFLLVPLLGRVVAFVGDHTWARAALDGVNAATIGLIAAVTFQLGTASIVDPLTAGIAVVSLLVLLRYPLSSPGLILVGALLGLAAGRG